MCYKYIPIVLNYTKHKAKDEWTYFSRFSLWETKVTATSENVG